MKLDIDQAFQELQRILKRHPVLVVGTGASCALDRRFGMPELALELKRTILPGTCTEQDQWNQVLTSLIGKGLEKSLDTVTDKKLIERIVENAGKFVAFVDRQWSWSIAAGEKIAPLHGLLKKLVDGLPPTDPIQHIVTPNYDMLIEHTCDALGVPWIDGFTSGSTCRRDWNAAENLMLKRTRELRGRFYSDTLRVMPHVRLYKVHGSINWFWSDKEESRLLRCDRMIDGELVEDCRRAMITPGRQKREAAGINREWFACADAANVKANAFLMIGYGFNDDHIHKEIKKRIVNQGCPGIVVTRDWSEEIKDWIRRSSDLWAVCQDPGGSKAGSIIVGPGNVDTPLVCKDQDLWNITTFSETIL